MWQYIKVQFAILLSTFSWQACVFLTAGCTLLTWSLLPSTAWHALAQKKAVATIEKVTAGSTTAELYGPFPGGEQETKPVMRSKIRRDDENFRLTKPASLWKFQPQATFRKRDRPRLQRLRKCMRKTGLYR